MAVPNNHLSLPNNINITRESGGRVRQLFTEIFPLYNGQLSTSLVKLQTHWFSSLRIITTFERTPSTCNLQLDQSAAEADTGDYDHQRIW